MSLEGKATANQIINDIKGKIIRLPETDKTLSKEGYSADAKATGDAINAVVTAANQVSKDGDVMHGELSMSNNKITNLGIPTDDKDAANKEYVNTVASKFSSPYNMLDNSDFTNPVNQRGLTVYNSPGGHLYTIDRWIQYYGKVTVNDEYVNWTSTDTANYKRFKQLIETTLKAGKTYTLAVLARINSISGFVRIRPCNGNGALTDENKNVLHGPIGSKTTNFTWIVFSFKPTEDISNPGVEILASDTSEDFVNIDMKAWCLYEGDYTADNLPEYKPKGYSTELLSCQRYFQRLQGWDYTQFGTGYWITATSLRVTVPLSVAVRIKWPTVSMDVSLFEALGEGGPNAGLKITDYTIGGAFGGGVTLILTTEETTSRTIGMLRGNGSTDPYAYIDISAEL